jgi:predicted AlkP superfamily pyrophosphatase or phosphodiesterase
MFKRTSIVLAAAFWLFVSTIGDVAAQRPTSTTPRGRMLEMFARSYFPGRSGQIMVVPREGAIVVSRKDPVVKFMHGSPWRYDTRIPLAFYGPSFVKAGTFPRAARQQDVMPTVASVLGVETPPTVTGQVLAEAIRESRTPPRVVVVAVLDGMRADYFDRYAAEMPTLNRMRGQSAWFSNAAIDYLPTITSLGHTTVSTGTDPRFHGTTGNTLFDRAAGKPHETYAGNSPRDLMVLNLADIWNLRTRGRAVIIAQGSSVPAAVGLAGHGACLFSAQPIRMASYSRQTGNWTSNEACYRLPSYVRQRNSREIWEQTGGSWMGHHISNADSVRRTSLFARFEADTLLSMMQGESVGADDVTDLVLVNLKTPDFVGHQYGPNSPELRETLVELDRQFARILQAIEKHSQGQFLLALTADHGMPSEPLNERLRVYTDDVVKVLHDRFDPEGRLVLQYEPESSQISIDLDRLAERKLTLADLARVLEQQPFVFAAFTETEVQRAARQPAPR